MFQPQLFDFVISQLLLLSLKTSSVRWEVGDMKVTFVCDFVAKKDLRSSSYQFYAWGTQDFLFRFYLVAVGLFLPCSL